MLKPASLRAALETALPDLAANPDRLVLYIDQGRIDQRAGATLSFEYRYRLNVVLLDYPHHASTAIVPIVAWLRRHQPEIELNPELGEQAFTFEAEILNHASMDLALRLLLTERVLVSTESAPYTVTHIDEPTLTDPALDGLAWQLVFVQPPSAPDWTTPDPEPV